VAVNLDAINGGILRGGELAIARRMDFAGDLHNLASTPG
jgi:hypothetical protein